MYILVMCDTLTRLLTCGNFGQTRVQFREENAHHRPRNRLKCHVKVYTPNSLLKDALREEECL
jgi:hypothetical protein